MKRFPPRPFLVTAAFALMAVPAHAGNSPSVPPDHYRIDPQQTDITARVAFFGLASKTADFPAMSGGMTLDPARPHAIALTIVLDARQLTAGDPVTLARLRGPSFFAADRYPEIRFTGTRMDMTAGTAARITGTLTARGITRPIVLDARFAEPPRPGQPITLTASAAIDRRDFGMTAYRFIVGSKVRIAIAARLLPDQP